MLYSQNLDETSMQRFIQEVEICMRFEHPGIVKVYEFGIHEDRPVLVMEFIEGISLDRYVEKYGPFSPGKL